MHNFSFKMAKIIQNHRQIIAQLTGFYLKKVYKIKRILERLEIPQKA